MRLPFPDRIPLGYAAVFASFLFLIQLLEGTETYFSLCAFLFVMVAAFAFNLAGGFTRPSGGYVFFYAVLTCILGWVAKAFLGEAADSNLRTPNLTVTVFLGGICSMALAVFASRKLTTRNALLGRVLAPADTPAAVIGCTVTGISIYLLENIVPHTDGSLISFLHQINNWVPLAIILGVTYQISRSRGTQSLNPVIVLAGLATFIFSGLLNFSKEGLFTPFICYALAAASLQYRFSYRQLALAAILLVLLLRFLVPYSQYGRNFRSGGLAVSQETFLSNAYAAGDLLADLPGVREQYQQRLTDDLDSSRQGYFNSDQGLVNRLTMLPPDDALISATEQGENRYGLLPLGFAFANIVPHFLWPDKPTYLFGNLYAHEIGGVLAENDLLTGVSFTPSGQAYHMAGWVGVLLIAPAVWCLAFVVFDSLCGDTRRSPWGLLVIAQFAHIAPEAMLDGLIGSTARYGVALVIAALACGKVMPLVVNLVAGRLHRMAPVPAPEFAGRIPSGNTPWNEPPKNARSSA